MVRRRLEEHTTTVRSPNLLRLALKSHSIALLVGVGGVGHVHTWAWEWMPKEICRAQCNTEGLTER